MKKNQLIEAHRQLLACAGGNPLAERQLQDWYNTHIKEVGYARIDEPFKKTPQVREEMHYQIADYICRNELALESFEERGNQLERRVRIYILN